MHSRDHVPLKRCLQFMLLFFCLFQSQDLSLLREEIECGLADLKKVTLVRNECAQLDWYGSNIGRSCSRFESYVFVFFISLVVKLYITQYSEHRG